MVIVAQALSSIVLTRSCSVPQSYFIPEFVGNESMHLEAKVEAWEAEDLIVVLEQDEEGEIEVTFVYMRVD